MPLLNRPDIAYYSGINFARLLNQTMRTQEMFSWDISMIGANTKGWSKSKIRQLILIKNFIKK